MRRYDIPKRSLLWDGYKEFYTSMHPIVYFATGELVVVDMQPHVGGRRHYGDFNVELDHGDTFRVVPQDKLPNYVCAALARWRLTSEKTATDAH